MKSLRTHDSDRILICPKGLVVKSDRIIRPEGNPLGFYTFTG